MAAAIEYALSLDTAQFQRGASSAQSSVGGLGTGIGWLVSKAGGLVQLTAGLVGIGSAMAAAGKGLKLAADIESTTVAFGTMLGSAEDGKKLMADIRKEAAALPFSLDEAAQASRSLLSVSGKDGVIADMRMLGDIAAVAQQPIDELSAAYAKIMSGGQVMAEDLDILTDRLGGGFKSALADELGVTTQELKKMGSEGKITSQHLEATFRAMTAEGGMAFGAMDAQAQTAKGMLDQVKAAVDEVLLAFGEPVMDMLKPYLAEVLDYAQRIPPVIQAGVQLLQSAVSQGKLGELTAAALEWAFGEAVNHGVGAFQFIADAGGRMLNFQLRQVAELFQGSFNGAFASLFDGIKLGLQGIGNLILAKLGGPFQEIAATFQAALTKGIEEVLAMVGRIPVLGEKLGLDELGRQGARSFAEILEESRGNFSPEALQAEGEAKLREAAERLKNSVSQYGEVAKTNLMESLDGLNYQPASVVDTDAKLKNLVELARSVDPKATEDFAKALQELTATSQKTTEAMKAVGEQAAQSPAQAARAFDLAGADPRQQRDIASLGQRWMQQASGGRVGLDEFLGNQFAQSQLRGSGLSTEQAKAAIEAAVAQSQETRAAGGTARQAREAFNGALRGAREDMVKPASEATAKRGADACVKTAKLLENLAVA